MRLWRDSCRLPRNQLPAITAYHIHGGVTNREFTIGPGVDDRHLRTARDNRGAAKRADTNIRRLDGSIPKRSAAKTLEKLRLRFDDAIRVNVHEVCRAVGTVPERFRALRPSTSSGRSQHFRTSISISGSASPMLTAIRSFSRTSGLVGSLFRGSMTRP